ncbi:hypothetical protein [Calothrix sp. CCY 0018]|uniref:hypothetical protein n=1 Tax=Calothrix sp. CCY 0018 TaxID=3103864 RepID=UPI0039C63212
MDRIAFLMLFLYIRSFDFSKYPEDFDDGRRESKSEDGFNLDELNRKGEEQLLAKNYQVEAKYFLERRTFL